MDIYTFKLVVEQLDDAMTMLITELYPSELLDAVLQKHDRVVAMLAKQMDTELLALQVYLIMDITNSLLMTNRAIS